MMNAGVFTLFKEEKTVSIKNLIQKWRNLLKIYLKQSNRLLKIVLIQTSAHAIAQETYVK